MNILRPLKFVLLFYFNTTRRPVATPDDLVQMFWSSWWGSEVFSFCLITSSINFIALQPGGEGLKREWLRISAELDLLLPKLKAMLP